MKLIETVILILIFSLGVLAHSIITQVFYLDTQQAFPVGIRAFAAPERLSPGDHIKEDQIIVQKDRVILDLADARWSSFTDTNSMDPLLDETAHGIEIKPSSIDDISLGDVISYFSEDANGYIIHRVIAKGEDDQGDYFILKGDNNPSEDPERVRFDQVHGILVAVIY